MGNQEQKTIDILMARAVEAESIQKVLYSTCPDMLWIRDKDNRYLWANSKTINVLLLQSSLSDIVGLTDLEIANKSRLELTLTDAEHTAGRICTDTDAIVLREHKPMKFIEVFSIRGVLLVLEVHKSIARNALGDVVGTTGVGRDITDDYKMLQTILTYDGVPEDVRVMVDKHLQKYDPKGYAE